MAGDARVSPPPSETRTLSEYRRREQSITLAPVEEQLGRAAETHESC